MQGAIHHSQRPRAIEYCVVRRARAIRHLQRGGACVFRVERFGRNATAALFPPRMVALIEKGRIDARSMITRTYPIAGTRAAIQDCADRTVITSVVLYS